MIRGLRTSRRSTAFHEAGHVVAMIEMNLPVRSASAIANAESLGRVKGGPLRISDVDLYNLTPRTRDRLERQIIVTFAGPEAERLFLKRYNHTWAANDYDRASDLLLRLTAGDSAETSAYVRWLRLRSRSLIDRRRALVEAVANALTERGTLTAAQIMETIADSIKRAVDH